MSPSLGRVVFSDCLGWSSDTVSLVTWARWSRGVPYVRCVCTLICWIWFAMTCQWVALPLRLTGCEDWPWPYPLGMSFVVLCFNLRPATGCVGSGVSWEGLMCRPSAACVQPGAICNAHFVAAGAGFRHGGEATLWVEVCCHRCQVWGHWAGVKGILRPAVICLRPTHLGEF